MTTTAGQLHGRVLQVSDSHLLLRNESGEFAASLSARTESINIGDLVEVVDGKTHLLTPNRSAGRTCSWMERVLDPRRLRAIEVRANVEATIRQFFLNRQFREVRTPLLVPCPGMEPHIRPFAVDSFSRENPAERAFLPTSPEFAMKRLLVGGLERIFQICPAFRDEPRSIHHHPEFTMLEWYRAYAGYEEIMRDTEEMFAFIAQRLFGQAVLKFQGREISVAAPWPRLRVRDLFMEHASVDLVTAASAPALAAECRRLGLGARDDEDWDDLYFKIWLNLIEPKLPTDRAVFVHRYPASQAALAVVDQDPDGTRWARRFEVYAGGIELGNAFEELTDPVEQRKRFEKDMELRERTYGPDFPKNPLDEGFLSALTEGMPPAGGIAMGVDRIVMLFADEPNIDFTVF